MRLLITAVLVLGLVGVAGAANLTKNIGTTHVKGPVALCTEPCRAGDVNENEPVCYDGYYDYTNGGCNSVGWTDLPAQGTDCIGHACGQSGTYYYGYYSYRDTDWFRCTTFAAANTNETVTAEFAPMVILIYASSGTISCYNYTYTYVYGTACAASVASAYIPQVSSEFWPWVGPQSFGYGVPCGSKYIMDVTNDMGPTCGGVPTQVTTWGNVKALYH